MSRPMLELRRPEKIKIRQGIVICRYRRGHCHYISGPYLDRAAACEAAVDHYLRMHCRGTR